MMIGAETYMSAEDIDASPMMISGSMGSNTHEINFTTKHESRGWEGVLPNVLASCGSESRMLAYLLWQNPLPTPFLPDST